MKKNKSRARNLVHSHLWRSKLHNHIFNALLMQCILSFVAQFEIPTLYIMLQATDRYMRILSYALHPDRRG